MPVPSRRRLPRWTVRLRLTLLYGGLFLLSGCGLLGITYLLVAARSRGANTTGTAGSHASHPDTSRLAAGSPQALQQAADLHQFLIQSGFALAIMAVAAIGLGWLVAGRILRPLRVMAAATRQISENNLHKRLGAQGPGDEIKDLADTIDSLLARLEAAFDSQRHFAASASHELRTPLALQRTTLELALADPAATAGSLRSACEEVLAEGQHQEKLVEALLTLARSQQALGHRVPADLATVAGNVLRTRHPVAQNRGLYLTARLSPALTTGDPRLIERLIANLVDNALTHNAASGRAEITTGTTVGHAVLTVTNTGPEIPADQVSRLFQPFQRAADPGGEPQGTGLGLSIVAAIAKAHDAILTASPAPGGGLAVTVSFPAPAARSDRPQRNGMLPA